MICKIEGSIIILTNAADENLYLAARNLPNVALYDTTSLALNPVALVRAEKVIVTEAAIKEIEGIAGNENSGTLIKNYY